MLKAMVHSEPRETEYHTPLVEDGYSILDQMMMSAARCARVTHANFDTQKSSVEEVEFAKRLIANNHWSPLEHPAIALSDPEERSGNYQGWAQFRKQYPQENQKVNIKELYEQFTKEHPEWN